MKIRRPCHLDVGVMVELVMKNLKIIDIFTGKENQEKYKLSMTTMFRGFNAVTTTTFVWHQRKNDSFHKILKFPILFLTQNLKPN